MTSACFQGTHQLYKSSRRAAFEVGFPKSWGETQPLENVRPWRQQLSGCKFPLSENPQVVPSFQPQNKLIHPDLLGMLDSPTLPKKPNNILDLKKSLHWKPSSFFSKSTFLGYLKPPPRKVTTSTKYHRCNRGTCERNIWKPGTRQGFRTFFGGYCFCGCMDIPWWLHGWSCIAVKRNICSLHPSNKSGWWFLPNPVEQYAQVKRDHFFQGSGVNIPKNVFELRPARNACSREKKSNLKGNMMPNEAAVATF